ncbi:MAG: WYL domain-containing protein [Microbacterium sp.]|nr:WYL domain-containing protein [Microbacterium sp.]
MGVVSANAASGSPAKGSPRGAPEERLVNLVVALMATEQGLTKDTILSSVAGYREQSEAGASKDALEKMFERDKESLRGLGVPIETIGDYTDPDDLREARYRVPTAEYALPADIEFTPAEIALLNVAGGVWSQSSLSAQARSGLRKIRALGIAVDEPIIGYSPRISLREPSFAALQSAIEQSRVVTFPYLKPGEQAARVRRIRPLALVEYEARWHVYGIDVAIGADRTFLLSRIVGDVVISRESFEPTLRDGAGERALAGLRDVAARNSALLEVNPGSEASLRLNRRATPAEQGIRVPFVDVHVFADELASYGPEVRVVEPAELRVEVVRRLEAALVSHTGSGSGR